MSQTFYQHIKKFTTIEQETFNGILSYFTLLSLKKKQNLVEAGQKCNYNYFVVEGCLRMFFINNKGIEQTSQFALEHWWLTDLFAFQQQGQSSFTIQAIEKSEVLAIDFKSYEKLLTDYPEMNTYFRKVYQTAAAAAQVKTKALYGQSKEELYYDFVDSFPDFVQRVPQYLLATYLGFTPEYLSELRSKKRS